MWDQIFKKEEELEYQKWLKTIIPLHLNKKSSLVRKEVATLLAIVNDNRSWDMFHELLLKKMSISSWVNTSLRRYAANSISERQINTLKRHSSHHSAKHMTEMRKAMRAGSTFTAAHKKAMKKVGK